MKVSGKLPSTPPVKIAIATPAYGNTFCGEYVTTIFQLLSTKGLADSHISFATLGSIDYSDIVVSSNFLLSSFYFNQPDCTHILFMDSDMGFPKQLIFDMINLKEDFVGAICPGRNINLEKLHARPELPYQQAYHHALKFIGEPITLHPTNPSFCETHTAGAGILLLSRQCIDKIVRHTPDIMDTKRFKQMPFGEEFNLFITPFDKISLEDRDLSEDLSFCCRWRKYCQGKIYAAIDYEIKHVMHQTIAGKYSLLKSGKKS